MNQPIPIKTRIALLTFDVLRRETASKKEIAISNETFKNAHKDVIWKDKRNPLSSKTSL